MSAEPKLPDTAVTVHKTPKAPMMMGEQGFEFSLDGAIRFAQGIVDSGMAPKGINHPGAVVALIEAGKELGLAPMYALSNLTFTNGRLGIMGDAAKALIRAAGVLKEGTDFEETYEGAENTPAWKCTISTHRKGQPAPFSTSFTLAEAIKANLAKIEGGKVRAVGKSGPNDYGPWCTYTKRMIMYRALGFHCRDRYSDVLGGCVLTEELRDYPPELQPRALVPPSEPDPLLVFEPARVQDEGDFIEAEVEDDRADLWNQVLILGTELFGTKKAAADLEVSAATSGKIQSVDALEKAGSIDQMRQVIAHFEGLKGC